VSSEPDPFALAFRYLSRRERTVSEMREHLLGREVAVAAVEDVIEELGEQGYLDDARYARVFAQDKRELEQWGSERIRQALLARGIDRELVDETLAAHDDGADDGGGGELGRALALLRRRFPGPPRDRRERERALGVLLRKGYDPELALDALSGYARRQP
jgi:regulatory protein